jgi:uncharacterized protein YgiM (DUF1202 family)
MAKVRVTAEHRPSTMPPIKVRPGDRVFVHERDSEWPAFVKVTRTDGGSGWVPSRHLSAMTGEASVMTAYDTQEVAGRLGEILTVIEPDDESGWLWCRNENGAEGWLPRRSVEPISGGA